MSGPLRPPHNHPGDSICLLVACPRGAWDAARAAAPSVEPLTLDEKQANWQAVAHKEGAVGDFARKRLSETPSPEPTPANPVNVNDEAGSWRLLDALLDACEAALAASPAPEPRTPGTYRTPEGGVEVIVGIEESASYVEDQWPDEVAFLIRRAAPEPTGLDAEAALPTDRPWMLEVVYRGAIAPEPVDRYAGEVPRPPFGPAAALRALAARLRKDGPKP